MEIETFNSKEEVRAHITSLSLSERRNYQTIKSDKTRLEVICCGCNRRLNFSSRRCGGLWQLTNTPADHDPQCEEPEFLKQFVSQKHLGTVVRNTVMADTKISPTQLHTLTRNTVRMNMTYMQVFRAKKSVLRKVEERTNYGFRLIESLSNQLNTLGHYSHIERELDHEGNEHLHRVFVSFHNARTVLLHSPKIVSLDGCHFRTGNGILLTAVGKDGDNQLYLIAFSYVPVENTANWTWFCRHLQEAFIRSGINSRELSFISDREKGLLNAVHTVFPSSQHTFCVFHIQKNLGILKTEIEKALFMRLVYANSEEEYHHTMETIRRHDEELSEKIEAIEPVHYSLFQLTHPRFNTVSSSLSESFNHKLEEQRKLPPLDVVLSIMKETANEFHERYLRGTIMNGRYGLTPHAEKMYEERVAESNGLNIARVNDTTVWVNDFNGRDFIVDFTRCTCTCLRFQDEHFPCIHAFQAHFCTPNFVCCCGEEHTIESYCHAYTSFDTVLTHDNLEVEEGHDTCPPLLKKQVGRPNHHVTYHPHRA